MMASLWPCQRKIQILDSLLWYPILCGSSVAIVNYGCIHLKHHRGWMQKVDLPWSSNMTLRQSLAFNMFLIVLWYSWHFTTIGLLTLGFPIVNYIVEYTNSSHHWFTMFTLFRSETTLSRALKMKRLACPWVGGNLNQNKKRLLRRWQEHVWSQV